MKRKWSENNRSFLCGCNKDYLSYPALYTHVKNKHDGVFPIGSNSKHLLPMKILPENYFEQNYLKYTNTLLKMIPYFNGDNIRST